MVCRCLAEIRPRSAACGTNPAPWNERITARTVYGPWPTGTREKKTRDSKIGQSKIVLSDWIRQGGPGRAPRWAALQCWATILRDPWSLWINGQPQVERKDLRTVRENEFDRRSENLKDGYRFRSAIRRFQVNYAFGMFDHHNSRWGEGTDADKETKKSEAAYLVDPLSWRGRKDPGRM